MKLATIKLNLFHPLVIITVLVLGIAVLAIVLLVSSGQVIAGSTPIFHISIGFLMLGLVAGLYYFVIKKLLLPFTELQKWSDRLRKGDLDTDIPLSNETAFKGVISDVNNLTHEVSGLIEEMDIRVQEKTDHIAAKSRSLEILYDIATDLSTARNLDELLEQFLDTLMVLVDAKA
ncbi:MAG: hypothetical protein ACC635_00900, partial [Acidiferrobacterales bacterium]